MEVTVRLHGALAARAGGRATFAVGLPDGATLGDLLDALGETAPGVERRIRDEAGAVRRHVNVFVDAEPVRPRGRVDVPLRAGGEVLVLPAVSGGAG